MDLLRRTGWLRVLTVLLVGLGSTTVAAQPHGPFGGSEGVAGDGTASETGFSLVETANIVGLVDAGVRGAEDIAGDVPSVLPPSPSVRTPRPAGGVVQSGLVLPAERPLRHRLCVYRL